MGDPGRPTPPSRGSPGEPAHGGPVQPVEPVSAESLPPDGSVPEGTAPPHKVSPAGTRASAAWAGLIAAALVLVLLLVFVLQNLRNVRITYFTASGSFPLGVALLLAALGGVLLAGLVASLRIVQLRRHIRRRQRGGVRGARRRPTAGTAGT